MRGKRSKQYKRAVNQYAITFGFREPFQVLVDSGFVSDATHCKMDLVGGLERILHGKVKPMITQCDIRHLYNATPKDENVINIAKGYERRRCGHHQLEEPLSTLDCLSEVVDPKGSLVNKHRYVVASQDPEVRAHMRRIPGVPLIYINRSVMILEPMASSTLSVREKEEKAKFRAGLKGGRGSHTGEKRKRETEDNEGEEEPQARAVADGSAGGDSAPQKKKRSRGPKEPNPLSVKKPKKVQSVSRKKQPKSDRTDTEHPLAESSLVEGDRVGKHKRKRKHKPKIGEVSQEHIEPEPAAS